jgi:bifunctional DNA-binding transcriptional regulator/antitoxin component of YhaV-PrlF toxin-antitoxin module
MSTVRLNYDGWLALPAAVRQKLGVTTGDLLELELSGETVTLRPWRPGGVVDRQAAELPVATVEPTAPAPPPAAPIVKRGPGRPRKAALPVVPPTLKARGGKRKAAPEAVR